MMTVDEVRQMIRNGLNHNGEVPPRREIRHHVLFKHKTLGKYGISLHWEDLVRLDQKENSCWLICGDSTQVVFDFFVVPHVVGRRLVSNDPLICKVPRKGSAVRTATQNVDFHAKHRALKAMGREECVKEYRNRADLFEKLVSDHWLLLKPIDPIQIAMKRCPRCSKNKLPDYHTQMHDYQCRNGKCHLLWCGDHWQNGEANEGYQEQRFTTGWWVYNRVTGGWNPWDGTCSK